MKPELPFPCLVGVPDLCVPDRIDCLMLLLATLSWVVLWRLRRWEREHRALYQRAMSELDSWLDRSSLDPELVRSLRAQLPRKEGRGGKQA